MYELGVSFYKDPFVSLTNGMSLFLTICATQERRLQNQSKISDQNHKVNRNDNCFLQ